MKHFIDLLKLKEHRCQERETIQRSIELIDEAIKDELDNNSIIKAFITTKLEEAIDKFNLNDNKDKNQTYTTSYFTIDSKSGRMKGGTNEYPNPDAEFIPSKDAWSIIRHEKDGNKHRITVENIKGRKYIGAFNWIADEYATDWFEI